jgi:2-amino-4-hydroxy-6-hydroxymethyldihydropteridine diphosphokinase
LVAGHQRTDVAWLGLGGNVGSRTLALQRLRAALERDLVRIEAVSAEILTRAHGVRAQGDFHNQVVRVRSPEPWAPEQWLAHCQAAERLAGRRETYRWGPRIADADILLLGDHGEITVDTERLTVPHPELPRRSYLLQLLASIGADWKGTAG